MKSMNCPKCNIETIRRTVDYPVNSRILGNEIVPLVEIAECPNCGETTLSAEAEREISGYLSILEEEAFATLPAVDLISAGQAAEILGVSKQAFSKNPKIKKEFVYYTRVGAKKVYFKPSVELFKVTGDGRFTLKHWHSSAPSNEVSKYATRSSGWQQISKPTDVLDDAEYTWISSSSDCQ